MKYNTRLLAKLALIFFGLLFLLCVWLGGRERKVQPDEGEKISCADVRILMDALAVPVPEAVREAAGGTDLTYAQYRQLCEAAGEAGGKLPDYADRYEPESAVGREDWYAAYRMMLAYLDPESSVWETEIFVLGVDEEEGKIYAENGAFVVAGEGRAAQFSDRVLCGLQVFVRGEELLTVVEELPEKHTLHNVWVTEAEEGSLECFYRGVSFRTEADETVSRESVADLTFLDGRAVAAREKSKKVHGRLLRLSDEAMEIEGCGSYSVAKDMEVYRLYGSLETLRTEDLRIGYADADYVMDGGQICACLVSEREDADRIRVLLKNAETGENYHEWAELVVDGERTRIEADDLETGERKSFRCAALTDRVVLDADGLQGEDPAYRGTIECCKDENGMALINELPLEEYLYAVVPSEMPASYPEEALKAQAVCARTYAYRYILHAGLPELGAHVDDTTAYQVYHNVPENVDTTAAVKETDGKLLMRGDQAAEIFYYSTSCGTGDHTPEELRDEETFRGFITSVSDSDPESGEAWYRWSYAVEKIDADGMYERITERYQASPASVQTRQRGGYYAPEPPAAFDALRDIRVEERGSGGVADALLIETDAGTYRIAGEYNIRYVLCDGRSRAKRLDGTSVVPAALVPSGFFVIDAGKIGKSMVGYTLTGGGYGHGVGMSQNGAKALGGKGVPCEEILRAFFGDCEVADKAALDGI